MKKILLAVAASLALVGVASASTSRYEVPLSSVAVPTECQGMTFTHAFKASNGVIVSGTSGNDLIFANDGNEVKGNGGDDCIVVNYGNSVSAGAGNDVVVSREGGNSLSGGKGNDTVYYHFNSDSKSGFETVINLDAQF